MTREELSYKMVALGMVGALICMITHKFGYG